MGFITYNKQERLKVWNGITGFIKHSDDHTFAYLDIENGSEVPEHSHLNEQWTHVLEGRLEFNLDGEIMILEPGMAAHMAPNQPHSVKALTKVKVLDTFYPVREDFKTLEPV